ncbi:hypothetical protein IWZ03DRAFT_404108 [Phyllosticta citriasiana]|uniref:Uncharacterized protein n=1 Tax=Phyllosticta citriasiana TaxID=595635 RepID=A0ABR1KUJ0_9PEZI
MESSDDEEPQALVLGYEEDHFPDEDEWPPPAEEDGTLQTDVDPVTLTSASSTEQMDDRKNTRTYTLKIELTSTYPLHISKLFPVELIKTGERAGSHAIYVRQQPVSSHFWNLPCELRKLILGFAMTSRFPIFIDTKGLRCGRRAQGETLCSSLLITGKRLCEEALEVLYNRSRFSMQSFSLPKFLEKAGGKADRHIREMRLQLRLDADRNTLGISSLCKLEHLTKLRLDFSMVGDKYVQLFVAKDFFAQAQSWMTQVAKRQDDKFAAVKMIETSSWTPTRNGTIGSRRREFKLLECESFIVSSSRLKEQFRSEVPANRKEALKELFVGIGNFTGNFSDKNEGMVVPFGGVGCVSLGPRIGQHVLYLKTQYRFPRFLDLPRELRDIVYMILMIRDQEILILRDSRFSENAHLTAGLLTVSKQVYEESIELRRKHNPHVHWKLRKIHAKSKTRKQKWRTTGSRMRMGRKKKEEEEEDEEEEREREK